MNPQSGRSWRRKWVFVLGALLLVGGSGLGLLHMPRVRHAVLAHLQSRLRESPGIVLEAKDLDYNLLVPWFQLEQVSIRFRGKASLPPILKAERVSVRLRYWDLITGSGTAEQISADGLALQWIIDKEGRDNFPETRPKSAGAGLSALRVRHLEITNVALSLTNEQADFLARLPQGVIHSQYNQANGEQAIRYLAQLGGTIRWKGEELPLDRFSLESFLRRDSFEVDSLNLVSTNSRIQARGRLNNFGAPQVDFSVNSDVDCDRLGNWMRSSVPVSGRVKVSLAGAGALDAVKMRASLVSDRLTVGGLRPEPVAARLEYDRQSGMVRIEQLSAGIFSGTMRARGQIHTGEKEANSALSIEFAQANVRQAASALGWKAGLQGVADARLDLAWPGRQWQQLQAKAVGQVRPRKDKTKGVDSFWTFAASAQRRNGMVRIKIDSVSVPGAALHGNVDLRLDSTALEGRIQGSISSLARFSQSLEILTGRPGGFMTGVPIDGAAELTASLAGSAKRTLVSVDFKAPSLSVAEFKNANLWLQANYSPDRIELKEGLLQWRGQKVTASGRIDLASTGVPLHLEARLDQLSIPEIISVYRVHPRISGTASAKISLSGSFSNPTATLTVTTDGLRVYGEPLGTLTSEVILQNQKLMVKRLRLEKPQPTGTGVAEGQGVFDLASQEYEFELDGMNLQASTVQLPGDVSLVGTFGFKADGKGAFDNPSAQLKLDGHDLQVARYPIGDLQVGVQLANHHAAVDLEAPLLQLLANAGIGTQEGYPIQFEITGNHTPLNLTHGRNALGTSFFDARIKGKGLLSSLETLEASADIQNLQLMLLGQEIRNSQPIEVGYAGQRLNIVNLALESGDSHLQVSGALPLRVDVPSSDVTLKAHLNLEAIGSLLPAVKFLKTQGIAELNGKIKGSLAQPELSGLLSLRDGKLQIQAIPSPVMNLNAELEMENGLISLNTLSGTLGGGTIRASGTLPLKLLLGGMTFGPGSLARSAQFSIQAEKIPWSSVFAVPEKTSGDFSMNIGGEASQLTLRALNARLQFGEILVKQERYELNQAVPTILNLRNSQIQVEQFQWKGPQTKLRVIGTAGLEADYPLDLRFSGEADVGLLQLFIPTLQASGPARLDLNVRGTARAPLLAGYVEASKATVGLRSPRLMGEDIALRIDLKGDRIDLTELSGSLNGGTLRGSGGAAWRNSRLEDVSLDLKGQDIFLNFPTGFKTTSELALQVRSRGRSIEVGGKVEVKEGSYHEPFDLGMISGAAAQSIRTTSASGPETVGADVSYNIELQTKQPIDVDNNLARFYASANVKLVGTVRQPGLLGTTHLDPGGKLYFGDRTYLIEQGVVTFTNKNRVDPVFDLFATTRVKDYEIGLRLTGTLKDSETTFTSDPPLSRDDIISVLLTGKTLSESGGTGINPSQAGTFSLATSAMNVNLSGKMRRAIGVSQVSIEPGLIAAESNPGARLTIGQDLTRNLRLIYSMNLTNSSDQIWIAEYDLRRRFVARAVQQTSDTNRVEFRHDLRFGGSSKPLIGIGVTGTPKRKVGQVQFGGNTSFENPPYPGGQQPLGCGGCLSADMRGTQGEHPPAPPSKEETSVLSKEFKMKSGDKYDFAKARKGVERVEKFYLQRDYLESRVRLQTSERAETVDLSVHIEAGRKVRLIYEGADLPKSVKHRVRQEWQSSVSDVQRSEDAIQAIQVHLAKEGYLQAQVTAKTGQESDNEKTVLFDIRSGIRFRNVKVVFEGLEKDEAAELMQFLERRNLKDAVYSEPRRLTETIARYLQQRGYLLAKVALPERQLDEEARTGRVVLPVTKGPEFTVAALRFIGNSGLTDEKLKTKLPITEGTVFDPSQIQPTLTALREQYGRNGFRNAEVDYELVRDDIKSSVEIRFSIQEKLKSVIQSVKIEGEEKVGEKFIRKQIEFSEGETQDVSETNRSIRRLYSTGAFARVDLESQPLPDLPADAQGVEPVNVVVRVQETRPYKFVYGGYFDSERGPGVIAETEARNLLGNARLLGLRTRLDRDYQEGRFYLTQPPLRQLPLQSTITSYWKKEKVRSAYDLETLGLTFQQEGRFREKFLFSYGYRYERKHVSLLSDPLFQNYRYSIAPLLATLSRTTRDDYLDPTRGSFTSHALEFAPESLGSTFGYVRYFGQYFKYFPILSPQYIPFGGETKRPRFIYATGLRVGLMKGLTRFDIVPSERFFAGGGTTVRGFEQDKLGPLDPFGNPLGGNAMLILNNELRFPFISILDAVGFVDIGNVYPTISDFSFSNLRKTAGFGLRLRSPFLMIRFDYGFKLDRRPGETQGALFISIGQAF